jgi:hypothetical protein
MSGPAPVDPIAEPSDWVPPLILMADYGHSFQPYIEAVYAVFHEAFVDSQPQFLGRWVRCRRDPIYDGKEAGFWHCTSQGPTEEERIPDLRRCERIRWVRAVIENHADGRIDVWYNDRRGDTRYSLWFNEEYLVVLADRRHTWQLITAFTTDRDHQRRKLRRERDESQEVTGKG